MTWGSIGEEILESMARTLWVTAYADAADAWFEEEGQDHPDHPRARGGQDWFDVAPETPQEAKDKAAEFFDELTQRNGLLIQAYEVIPCPKGSPSTFGYYLVMEGLGHGVAWTDHGYPPHKLDVPYIEFSCWLQTDGEIVFD